MGYITAFVKFDTKGEGSPLNTHMRYSNRQFCDSGNTLGRLIAPSLSQRPMLLALQQETYACLSGLSTENISFEMCP